MTPPAPFPFATIGFDLDGTLVDSSRDLAGALNQALAMVGRPPLAVDHVLRLVGGGTTRLLRLALGETGGVPEERFDTLYRALVDHYAEHIADESRVYPGAIEAIDALCARGVTIAVVTNKLAALADRLLTALGVRERIDVLIGGDTLGAGVQKPDPAPIVAMVARCGGGRAAFVGDSIYDVAAACAAGVPVVAVSFGFSTKPAAELGANAVIDDYAALVSTLEELGR